MQGSFVAVLVNIFVGAKLRKDPADDGAETMLCHMLTLRLRSYIASTHFSSNQNMNCFVEFCSTVLFLQITLPSFKLRISRILWKGIVVSSEHSLRVKYDF